MDEWGGESPDGRIEMELVEHGPAQRRGRGEIRPAPAPPPPAEEPAEPHVTEAASRNRVIAIAAAVGVAGLLVGWLAGRAGGDDGLGAAPVGSDVVTATTTPTSFADDPALVEPDEPVLSGPPTTRRRPTTTTQPPVVVEPLTGLDPRLQGLPYEIVTLNSRGDLVYINLASGNLTTVDRTDRDDMGAIRVGADWVAIPSGNSNSAVVYHDGDPDPDFLRGFDAWSTQHVDGAATLWVPDDGLLSGSAGSMIEIDSRGEPTGAAVPVPGHPIAVDSTGAFLLEAPGGTYVVSAAGTSRLTRGIVVGHGATAALVYECDEQLACATLAVDRATGERRQLPGLFEEHRPERMGWWGSITEAISPDGRWAVVAVPEILRLGTGGVAINGWAVTLVDLVSGTSTGLDLDTDWPSSVHWTADSRFAFLAGSAGLFAFDPQTAELLHVAPDAVPPMQTPGMGLRPSGGNVWSDS